MKCVSSVLFTFVLISISFAQTAKTASQPNAVSVKNQSDVKITPKNNEKHMTGMLVSLDNQKQTFVVQLHSKDYPFQVNASTKIEGKNGKISLSDLKPGNAISVEYLRNFDSRTALSISQSVVSSSKNTQKANSNTSVTNTSSTNSIKVDSLTELPESQSKSTKPINVAPAAQKATAAPAATEKAKTPSAAKEEAKAAPAPEKAKAPAATEKNTNTTGTTK